MTEQLRQRKRLSLLLIFAATVLAVLLPHRALAYSWYIKPLAGGHLSIEGGPQAGAVGGALGYRWNIWFSNEVRYLHVFGDEEAHSVEITAMAGYPFSHLFPFIMVGAGAYLPEGPGGDPQSLVRLGGGLSLTTIESAPISVELSYLNLNGSRNFVQPLLSVTIGF